MKDDLSLSSFDTDSVECRPNTFSSTVDDSFAILPTNPVDVSHEVGRCQVFRVSSGYRNHISLTNSMVCSLSGSAVNNPGSVRAEGVISKFARVVGEPSEFLCFDIEKMEFLEHVPFVDKIIRRDRRSNGLPIRAELKAPNSDPFGQPF